MIRFVFNSALFACALLGSFRPANAAAETSELRLALKAAATWLHKLDDRQFQASMDLLRFPPNDQRGWLLQRRSEYEELGDVLDRNLLGSGQEGDDFLFTFRTRFLRGNRYQIVRVKRFGAVRWAVAGYELQQDAPASVAGTQR